MSNSYFRTSRWHSDITHDHPPITLTNYKKLKIDIFLKSINFVSLHLIIIKETAHHETFTWIFHVTCMESNYRCVYPGKISDLRQVTSRRPASICGLFVLTNKDLLLTWFIFIRISIFKCETFLKNKNMIDEFWKYTKIKYEGLFLVKVQCLWLISNLLLKM